MTGCGSRQQVEASDSIELLEPVSAAANTEAAAYRNIYEYKVLAGTVYPYIREYSFICCSIEEISADISRSPFEILSPGAFSYFVSTTSCVKEYSLIYG